MFVVWKNLFYWKCSGRLGLCSEHFSISRLHTSTLRVIGRKNLPWYTGSTRTTRRGSTIVESSRLYLTPLILSTSGGIGPECAIFLKLLAKKIAQKKNQDQVDVVRVLRTEEGRRTMRLQTAKRMKSEDGYVSRCGFTGFRLSCARAWPKYGKISLILAKSNKF